MQELYGPFYQSCSCIVQANICSSPAYSDDKNHNPKLRVMHPLIQAWFFGDQVFFLHFLKGPENFFLIKFQEIHQRLKYSSESDLLSSF